MILFVFVLHLLWIFSVKMYYYNTYKKYLETQTNFDWALVFKNKQLPYTEIFDILFYNEKIGTMSRTYSSIFREGFSIITSIKIAFPDTKLFSTQYKLGDIVVNIRMNFDLLYRITGVNLYVYEYTRTNSTSKISRNALLTLFVVKEGKKLNVELNSKFLPVKRSKIEISEETLSNYVGQNFIFFGSRPAVGKSWTIKFATFEPIEAVVEEKFVRKFADKELVIYSISYTSKSIRGYGWIDENGELLRFILYKPPISIVKQGIRS